MPNLDRQSLRSLALIRLEDARVLFASNRFSAAYYLSGYVVECALKACIAKQTKEFEFPDKNRVTRSYTHRLVQLAEVAQIPTNEDFSEDGELGRRWTFLTAAWSEDSRYEDRSQQEAHDLLNAVDDPQHGVLQWLRRYW